MATIVKDLGAVTAYAYAVAGGYTGTEEEFQELLGNIAEDLSEIENLTVEVTTLPAGSSATASYSSGVLSLGIPKGDKGDTGYSPEVSVSSITGGHSVTITDKDHPTGQTFSVMDGIDSSNAVREALLQIAEKVTYIDGDGQDYYDDLYDALYPSDNLVSISAVYTQSGTVSPITPLDDLLNDLVVTATWSDESTSTVPNRYITLSGTLTVGTSTITVSFKGKTTTFTVTVTMSVVTYDYIKQKAAIPNDGAIIVDFPMSSDYTFETSVYYSSTSSTIVPILGTRASAGGAKNFALFLNAGLSRLYYWLNGTDSTTAITPTLNEQINTIKVQPVGDSLTYPNNATISLNGTEFNTTVTATGVTWNSWIGFFGYASSSTTSASAGNIGLRIGETKIKDANGVLIHDLVPAVLGTYNGFYDSITDKFYYNANNNDIYECGNW